MSKEVTIIGVPMDFGQTRRGVDMGPSAIRYAGLTDRLEGLGYSVYDEGDLNIKIVNEETEITTNLKNLKTVADANDKLGQKVDYFLKSLSVSFRRRS